jgi:hypothetical protein
MRRPNSARALSIFLASAVLSTSAACSTAGPRKSEFERHFERYLSQSHQKAMAIAGDLDGEWTYGYGYRWRSTVLAIDKAFEECNRRRHDMDVVSECRLYAVGNEIIEGNPELEARYGRP